MIIKLIFLFFVLTSMKEIELENNLANEDENYINDSILNKTELTNETEINESEVEIIEGVYQLNANNIQQFLENSSHLYTLIKFYTPWCQHCKDMQLDYQRAAKEVIGTGISLAEVNMSDTRSQDLSKIYNITGYPTLKFCAYGEDHIEYKGDRDQAGIVYWLKGHCPGIIFKKKKKYEEIRVDDHIEF